MINIKTTLPFEQTSPTVSKRNALCMEHIFATIGYLYDRWYVPQHPIQRKYQYSVVAYFVAETTVVAYRVWYDNLGRLVYTNRWTDPHRSMHSSSGKQFQPAASLFDKTNPSGVRLACDHVSKELAAKLGVRGLPMIILFKKGKRIDHMTTANINAIEEAIQDSL